MADDDIGFANFDELLLALETYATPKRRGGSKPRVFRDSANRTAEAAAIRHQRDVWLKQYRKKQRKKNKERTANRKWKRKVFRKVDGRIRCGRKKGEPLRGPRTAKEDAPLGE